AAAPAAHAPVPAHPATRSRKAVTPSHTTAAPSTLAPGAMAGPKLLAGMPLTETPLGPDAPSVSELPQYAGVKNMSQLAPTLAAAHAAEMAAPPSLPVLGQLPPGGLTQNLPLAGGLQSLPLAGGLGGVTGLLGHF
ncbi:MAG: hypothetical protein HOW97_13255, partial [Catenulispora sp.]|nr:hypothetical protein [Catenulispora sp.]